MSYAKSLRSTLKDKNGELFNRLQPIENAAKSVLTYTVSKFPYYTPHDFSHSLNVEENLNWLVPDEIKSKMNDYEVFFLLVAAWLHDWGMVASESENAEEVRSQHHIRTEANFEKFYDKIHLYLTEARIIGRIVRGHRQEDLFDSRYDDSFFGINILVRIRFLAALLRIADECDVTANRTPEVIYYSLAPKGASEEEFKKHLSIQGIGKLAPYKLLLNGVAWTPKGVEVIEGVQKRIQSQIDSTKTILASNGVTLDLIEARIDTRGFINKPIEFELDRKTIVDLLIGNAIYSREDTAIREMLQNAVDTCRFRKLIDTSFEPRIEIEFDRGQVSFEDNGLGMNFEDASQYFSKKGTSFYVSKDLHDILKGKKFDSISKFGIGVLASFMIADKMIVETKKNNCAPCRFTIMDLSEGWTYEEGSRRKSGTKVVLFLNERGKRIDIAESLRHYTKSVPIPIFTKNSETGEKREFLQEWEYSIPEVLKECDEEDRERFSQSKPLLTLNTTTSDLEATYYVFEKPFFSENNCFLLQHGVYVGNFEFFPYHNDSWIALISSKAGSVDLKVSREDIVKNNKFEAFLGTIYDTFLSEVNRHCATKVGSDLNSLKKYIEFSVCMNDFFYDRMIVDPAETTGSLWSLKLNTERICPVLLKSGLTFLSGKQIALRRFSNIIHLRLPLVSEEDVEVIIQMFFHLVKENEAIIIGFVPSVLVQSKMGELLCSFCEFLKSNGASAIECCNLSDLIPKLEFKRENSPIDNLLPYASFFTHMPDQLRSLTAQLELFEFEVPVKAIAYRPLASLWYFKRVGKEVFRDDPEIAKVYDEILEEKRDYKLLSHGRFAYDMGDPFLRFIISKSEDILSNEPMKKLIQRYLRSLAVYYISPERLVDEQYLSVTIQEKTIAEMLDYSEYVPLKDRSGKLTSIYKAARGMW